MIILAVVWLAKVLFRRRTILLLVIMGGGIYVAAKLEWFPWQHTIDRSPKAQMERWPETQERLIIDDDGTIIGIKPLE